jgi:hypothetical protein
MLSCHFKTPRGAGIASTQVRGRRNCVQPRRADLEARVPGVLDSVHAAAASRILAARHLLRSEPVGKS